MSFWPNLTNGLRALFRKDRVEAELDEELNGFLEMAAEEKAKQGMSHQESRRAARLERGGLEATKEEVRTAGWESFVESCWQDLRFAARMLCKSPGYTAVAILTLALGIGANTAIFSVVDWMLLRPLPVHAPEQLTFLGFPQGAGNLDLQFSIHELNEIRASTASTFSDVAGLVFGSREGGQNVSNGLTVNGQTLPFQAVFVSGDFFKLVGIQPYRGRFILPEEGASAGSDPVVVLSYRYWQKRFRGDESIVGKQAQVNGHPVTIIGIAPRGFAGLTPIIEMEGYLPLGMLTVQDEHAAAMFSDTHWRALSVFGRLKPGLSRTQAQASLAALGAQVFHDVPRTDAKDALTVTPLRPPGMITGSNPLPKLAALFLTLAGIVLAVCCVNVANLSLVRTLARQHEMAVRSALGAGRGRLVRQLLTESVLVALLGCAGGILAGLWASRVLASVPTQSDMPFAFDLVFDWRVFAFAFAVALATGVFVGIAPALRISRGNLNTVLHASNSRSVVGSRSRLRSALVAIQIGGSLTLLIAAGLFTRSLLNARNADLGFDPARVSNYSLDPHEIGYGQEQGLAFYNELLERLTHTPGVEAANVITPVPLSDDVVGDELTIPGMEAVPGKDRPSADCVIVTPGHFKTLRIEMLSGRDFARGDDAHAQRVAIINRAMAERFWAKSDPIGRQFMRRSDPKNSIQVIGVARNIRTEALYGPYVPTFYVPLAQNYVPYATLQVRASGDFSSVVGSVTGTVRSLAPTMPVTGVRSMSEAVHGMNGLLLFDIGAALAAALGGLGLALALVGVYGVLSYATNQRTQEIGIRMAMGARPTQILKMVGLQGLWMVLAGVAFGVVASLLLTPLLADFLIGVKSTDPATYVSISVLLAAAAFLAAFVPTRRATRIDPLVALRHE